MPTASLMYYEVISLLCVTLRYVCSDLPHVTLVCGDLPYVVPDYCTLPSENGHLNCLVLFHSFLMH